MAGRDRRCGRGVPVASERTRMAWSNAGRSEEARASTTEARKRATAGRNEDDSEGAAIALSEDEDEDEGGDGRGASCRGGSRHGIFLRGYATMGKW